MILVYTGNGKGKTSACVGQAIRALGQGFIVLFAQFMKKNAVAGEQQMLTRLLKDDFYCNGQGFYLGDARVFPAHRAALEDILAWVSSGFARLKVMRPEAPGRMLILDEALYALGSGLLKESELRGIIDQCRAMDIHLVLSGRGLPEWLTEEADLISEIQDIKHPLQSGIKAGAGIEF